MWFCGRRIRAGRSTGRATEEFREGGDDESRVPHYFDSGTVGRDWIHRGVPRGGSFARLLAVDSAFGAFGRRDVVARAEDGAQGEVERAVRGGGRSARLKKRQPGCALQSHVHYRDIQIDSGRRDSGGAALHFCAVDRMQPAMHVVRHGVRISRRDEDERRGCTCASR